MRFALALATVMLPAAAGASEALVPELEQRLAGDSVEAVNSYLVANTSSALVPFGQKVAACELRATSLAVQLSRSANVKATQAYVEPLRIAIGRCTGFVLALASQPEVPKFCASIASWTVGHTVRELRRRMAAIEADEVLRNSPSGKSCRAAYLHELQTTRVVLRSAAPEPRARQRE